MISKAYCKISVSFGWFKIWKKLRKSISQLPTCTYCQPLPFLFNLFFSNFISPFSFCVSLSLYLPLFHLPKSLSHPLSNKYSLLCPSTDLFLTPPPSAFFSFSQSLFFSIFHLSHLSLISFSLSHLFLSLSLSLSSLSLSLYIFISPSHLISV
jgi:hypothetical protein